MSTSILGVEIRDSALMLAQVTDGRVTAAATAPLPAGLMEKGRIIDPAPLAELLRRLRRAHSISARRCVLVLPPLLLAARRLNLPRMDENTLKQHLPFEFRDCLDAAEDAVSCAFQLTESREDAMELYAAAIGKAEIAHLRQFFRLAGLDLISAIPKEIAWANLLERQGVPGPAGVLTQNTDDTQLSILCEGKFLMGRKLEQQADIFTQVRQALNFFALSAPKPVTALYLDSVEAVKIPGLNLLPVASLLPKAVPAVCAPAAGAALNPDAMNLAPKSTLLRPRLMLLLTAILTAAALIFAKFGLTDPLEEKARAYEALSSQQVLYAQMEQRLAEYPALEQEYLRRVSAGMTEAELALADPSAVLTLVETVVFPACQLENLTLSGNVLTLELRGISLEAAGTLVSRLEEEPLVDAANIHSAESLNEQDARILLHITLTKEGAAHE